MNIPPPRRPTHRLYIDEIGHASLKTGVADNDRYLSLIGVICELDFVRHTLTPQLEALKRHFVKEPTRETWQDPDDPPKPPVVFHRNELAAARYPFDALRVLETRQAFDSELLNRLEEWEYTVVSVVIDKEELKRQNDNPSDPYHYGMEILLERYVHWLEGRGAIGDVMAEARGGKEDRRLKSHYQSLYQFGADDVSSSKMTGYLTSSDLKLRTKKENIAGLQLAEFLISACFAAALARNRGIAPAVNFNSRIETIVRKRKYHRNALGIIEGYGCKWLP